MNQDNGDEERTTSTRAEKAAPEGTVGEIGQEKQDAIRVACAVADVAELQRLAESAGGFLTDSLRRLAWPILLGLPAPKTDDNDDEPLPASEGDAGGWKELPRHRDEDQVQLDVNRSFVYYPHGNYHHPAFRIEASSRQKLF
ncbi:hypothetical protein NLG97_g8986 [Lecanicillium saksenae]|uniref:Uncharacterized protein n=1 Tax=Lecanicillium saksenae TaxID=468837 RepID=A0ACC1QHA5_9HYPO|nr:hypothetical protein NLG97_g8986 [Lecanicillium saksenae]